MRVYGQADDIRIEGDEDGFHVLIETNVGDFDFRIHHLAEQFHGNVNDTIGSWLREAQEARYVHPGQITVEDLDAYPPGDPKRITLEREMNR